MFTWSFGCTSSPASAAITSFAFMFELVPEPVWNTSIGNWSSNSPAAIRSPADAMRSATSLSSSPRSAFTRAAAALIRPSQRATGAGIGSPETVKFAIAFSVSAPQRASDSAAFATDASLAPARQTAPDEGHRGAGVVEPHDDVPQHRVVRLAASTGVGRPPERARGLARREDELGALGNPRRGGTFVVRRLVGVPVESVAIGPNVSTLVGLVAASIPDGSRVLAPDVEFTSELFPFLVQEHRGVTTRLVPAAELAGEIGPDVDVVAFSAVQMATGEVADLDAIAAAAAEHDVMTVVDATQAVGWLPLDASRFDVVAAHAYKWLMSPRGTAFMTIAPERLDAVVPQSAGWFAGEDPLATFFGGPLRLAASARRLDTSPAWFMWVATAPALAVIEEIGVDAIHEHDLALANRFRAGLGLEPSNSAIVFCDSEGAADRLARAGIQAAVRGGRLRTSWHVYNTVADVERALDVLSG